MNARPIDPHTGMLLAKRLVHKAQDQGIRAAVGGGLAMACHGFIRATKDIDIILEEIPEGIDMEVIRPVSFGGIVSKVDSIDVDWITRNDHQREVYSSALDHVVKKVPWEGVGRVPVISAEWMVLIKMLAHRDKDIIDVMWLLREPKKVNRHLLTSYIEDIYGKHAYLLLDQLENMFLEADYMRGRERGK